MTMISKSHQAADAMDWNEAMVLVQKMYDDGMVRDSLLIDAGCFLGLRVSDLLRLRWEDLLSDEFVINEQKTGKTKRFLLNKSMQKEIARYIKQSDLPDSCTVRRRELPFFRREQPEQEKQFSFEKPIFELR